jgi:hypothetical protein
MPNIYDYALIRKSQGMVQHREATRAWCAVATVERAAATFVFLEDTSLQVLTPTNDAAVQIVLVGARRLVQR